MATEHEHPALTEFKRTAYSGRSWGSELAKRGYVVIAIDMFYWGERRMLLPQDPPVWRDRDTMSVEDVAAFNRRSSANTSLIATGLFEAGITWSGVMFLDDIRTVDYLATRPEVDPDRIGCCGLSVGGFRSAHLAGLDSRIKAAVVVGWMSTYGAMLQNKLTSIGFMKVVPGLYQYMDLPDVVSMTAPGGLMIIHGTRDQLFTNDGVQAAFDKIAAVYKKAGVPDRFQGVTYDGPHEFNAQMQEQAFAWLDRWLTHEDSRLSQPTAAVATVVQAAEVRTLDFSLRNVFPCPASRLPASPVGGHASSHGTRPWIASSACPPRRQCPRNSRSF